MGKYDDAAKRAAASTDQELADSLAKLGVVTDGELKVMLPDVGDQEKIKKLMDAIISATHANERAVIWKAFKVAALATAGGVAVVAVAKKLATGV